MAYKVKLHEDESLLTFMEGRRSVDTYTTPTSRKARLSVDVKKQLGIILRYIVQCSEAGACDFEGIRDLKSIIPTIENSWRPRRGKLFQAGLICLAGFTRKSPSGNDCDVWVATALGKQHASTTEPQPQGTGEPIRQNPEIVASTGGNGGSQHPKPD